jgi:hypothetical protein
VSICVADIRTRQTRYLTEVESPSAHGANAIFIDYSPDSQFIAFVDEQGICRVNTDGSNRVVLYDEKDEDGYDSVIYELAWGRQSLPQR